jgi:formamidopyrimidine-DNA glycosylase
MFELPEVINLARQINETLTGKIIKTGSLGNSPHKFVWYNRTHEEFTRLTKGKTIGEARAKGRWLFIPLEPVYVLLFGEFGGKIVYHPADSPMQEKYHDKKTVGNPCPACGSKIEKIQYLGGACYFCPHCQD